MKILELIDQEIIRLPGKYLTKSISLLGYTLIYLIILHDMQCVVKVNAI